MALALGKGFMAAGLVAPEQVLVSAPSDTNLVHWRQFNASTTHINSDVIRKCDVIFLAVKPHLFPGVIKSWEEEAKGEVHQDGTTAMNEEEIDAPHFLSQDPKLFISVMAGVTTKTLYDCLSSIVTKPRIVRANPNTPAMVGCGASAFSLGQGATFDDANLTKQLLGSVGLCELIPESQQNAFTGLAASGPAYIYTILEGLADGGVRCGLPRDVAVKFAAQMTMGAAKMSLDSGKHTGQLKDEVTSPGGTTIRAVQVMEKAGIRGIMMDAVQASTDRANELGKN